jgi:hypothetical protein
MPLKDTEIKSAQPTGKSYSLNDPGALDLDIVSTGDKLGRW